MDLKKPERKVFRLKSGHTTAQKLQKVFDLMTELKIRIEQRKKKGER